jgi:hypothetical protein
VSGARGHRAHAGHRKQRREIYEACAPVGDPANVVLNQFSEFANHLVHYAVTGRASSTCSRPCSAAGRAEAGRLRLGQRLGRHARRGRLAEGPARRKIVAVEALECPTMLYNGFGEHNIQGIGDKHIPYIHNVTNTDVAVAVSDHATDAAQRACSTTELGQALLRRARRRSEDVIARCRTSGCRQHLQRAGRHQDRQGAGPGRQRRDRHRGHRRRRAVHLRAPKASWPSASAAASTAPPPIARSHAPDGATAEHVLPLARSTATASSTSATSPGSNSRACRWPISRPPRPGVLARLHGLLPVWDEMIRAFNRRPSGVSGASS